MFQLERAGCRYPCKEMSLLAVKAHSHNMRLTRAGVADRRGDVGKIELFLFFALPQQCSAAAWGFAAVLMNLNHCEKLRAMCTYSNSFHIKSTIDGQPA